MMFFQSTFELKKIIFVMCCESVLLHIGFKVDLSFNAGIVANAAF